MDRIMPATSPLELGKVGPVNGGVAKGLGGSGKVSNEVNNGKNLSAKLVPEDQRLSTLSEKFDDKTLKRMGVVECMTCATRTYQDGSDDPGVSFKAPTHISPERAASAVMSHEMEHVTNEQAAAEREGKEVVNQSVQIFRDVCPECGKSYVSGGVTKTTTAEKSNPYSDTLKNEAEGNLVDMML